MSRKSFGLIQEGGVYIPKLKHWVLTPKLDNTFVELERQFLNEEVVSEDK